MFEIRLNNRTNIIKMKFYIKHVRVNVYVLEPN